MKRVDRVVCGGCMDFKVITSLTMDGFGAWDKAAFSPEAEFLEALKAVDGLTEIETQTFTFQEVV